MRAACAGGRATLPDSVRFRDEVVFGTRERIVAPATHPSGRSAGAEETPWESRLVVNRWWIEDGALAVRFSDEDEEEWSLRLAFRGEHLEGTASFRGDATPSGLSGPVTVQGTREACSF